MENFITTMNLMGTCSICLMDLDGVISVTPCWHKFHKTCIMQWFRFNSKCPNCRSQLKQENVRRNISFGFSDFSFENEFDYVADEFNSNDEDVFDNIPSYIA